MRLFFCGHGRKMNKEREVRKNIRGSGGLNKGTKGQRGRE